MTSRLQHLKVGDDVLISKKPTGTLVAGDLNPGKHLYLLSTGTGIAPFLSITKDPEIYEQFEKIILVHGVRYKKDLAYYDRFTKELPEHEYLGDLVKEKIDLLSDCFTRRLCTPWPSDRFNAQRQTLRRHWPSQNQSARRPRHVVRQPCHVERHLQRLGRIRPDRFSENRCPRRLSD